MRDVPATAPNQRSADYSRTGGTSRRNMMLLQAKTNHPQSNESWVSWLRVDGAYSFTHNGYIVPAATVPPNLRRRLINEIIAYVSDRDVYLLQLLTENGIIEDAILAAPGPRSGITALIAVQARAARERAVSVRYRELSDPLDKAGHPVWRVRNYRWPNQL